MAYTTTNKNNVKEKIEEYTKDYLDRYIIDEIDKRAIAAMDSNETPVQVADAVYDYLYENHKADIVISTVVQQCIPGSYMLILRQEIIKTLS